MGSVIVRSSHIPNLFPKKQSMGIWESMAYLESFCRAARDPGNPGAARQGRRAGASTSFKRIQQKRPRHRGACELAERVGFEPTRVISPTRFRDARTRPNYATSPGLRLYHSGWQAAKPAIGHGGQEGAGATVRWTLKQRPRAGRDARGRAETPEGGRRRPRAGRDARGRAETPEGGQRRPPLRWIALHQEGVRKGR